MTAAALVPLQSAVSRTVPGRSDGRGRRERARQVTSGSGARPAGHRHRPDHPEAVPEAHRTLRVRRVRVLRLEEGSRCSSCDARMQGAQILVAGRNFACGSSREHAAWALEDAGSARARRRASATSSGRTRSTRGSRRSGSSRRARAGQGGGRRVENELTIDLETLELSHPGGLRIAFAFDPFAQHMLVNGLDDVALTLARGRRDRRPTRRRHPPASIPARSSSSLPGPQLVLLRRRAAAEKEACASSRPARSSAGGMLRIKGTGQGSAGQDPVDGCDLAERQPSIARVVVYAPPGCDSSAELRPAAEDWPRLRPRRDVERVGVRRSAFAPGEHHVPDDEQRRDSS